MAIMTSTHASDALNFSTFDKKAKNGDNLRVAFIGGSLTWGAKATDPMQTSYRALIEKKLVEHYPKAHFVFKDAAIGGTGSQLAAFRLDRDVFASHPDLVFLEFTINDGAYDVPTPSRLASYESLVRRLLQADIPVLQIILPAKNDVLANPKPRPIDAKHKEIAAAYGLPSADAVALVQERVASGKATPDELWDTFPDVTHPGDPGYALYAEAVWVAFEKAVSGKAQCHVPEKMLHADTYMKVNRWRIADQPTLPQGWTKGKPGRAASAFDFVCSRWMENIAIAGTGPLKVKVRGCDVLLFGEMTKTSGSYEVTIDGGKPKTYSAKSGDGNMRLYQVIAEGLSPDSEHEIVITPILQPGEEIHLESLCVAGSSATVSGPLF